MDLTSARTLLRRINRLFEDLDTEPSALERDLLREYVRRFYESLTDGAEGTSAPAPQPAIEPKSNGASTNTRHERERDRPRPPKPSVEFVPSDAERESGQPLRHGAPKPKLIQIPPDVEQDLRRIEHQVPKRPYAPPRRIEPVAEAEEPTPSSTPEPATLAPVELEAPAPAVPEKTALSPELKELFAVERGNELSDRLATQPITDLHRAFGINDTLVTKSQLFGNDSAEFNAALKHLNGLTSYDDAVAYLAAGPATHYDWAKEEKRSAARTFVKLVRRRYVS